MIDKSRKAKDSDTFIGGERRQFQTTLWTHVLHAGEKDGESRRAAWETLTKNYWKPVYAWIRARWAGSHNEDAKDLTQEFFLWMMETDFPGRADASRGRFRTFLLAALKNYLVQGVRNRRRQKRGGARPILSLDVASDVDPAASSADDALDRSWREELIARGLKELMEEYRSQGKEVYGQVFRDYYLADGRDLTHQELAARYAISVSDVNNFLMHAKRLFREILKDLVAETVDGPEELAKELKMLFGNSKP